MNDKNTTWYLRLKDLATGPLKKLMDVATGVQNKFMGVQGGFDKLTQKSNMMGRDFKRSFSQLDTLLENLKKRQSEAFSIKHISAYQRMIDKTRKEMERLNKVSAPSKWQQFKSNIGSMGSQVPGVGSLISTATNPYMLAAGAALSIGVATTKLAMDYETGMAKINATAQLPADTLGKLKDRLVEIGSTSGGNFELMPSAYEKILSQTNDVNLSLDVLQTAVKGAKAGFTDIDTVAGALAQTLSVVGSKNTTANEVMDTLLKAKAVGAGEFADFAQYLPQLIAAGDSLHVGFKDVSGLFAYMTAKGQGAAESAMLLQNAFTALQKDDIMKGLAKKGINLFDSKGMRRNIKDVFLELTTKLSGLTDKKKTKFLIDIDLKDAQARSAFSILTSEGKKFKEIMEGVNGALGETDKQLAMTGNTARTWGDIWDKLKAIGLAIGDFLIPPIDFFLQGLMDIGRTLKDLVSSEWWANFFGAVDEKKAFINSTRIKVANENALKTVNNKFGAYSAGENPMLTKQRNQALVNVQDILVKASAPNQNKIVPNGKVDGKEPKKISDINTGNSSNGSSGGSSSSSGVSGSGGGVSGNRSLVQNLYINIHIKKSQDLDDGTLKRKLTDVIVDAGRDGMVTLGI
jgi:TP901 family phage tail tape measure protein